ncbi:antibiotic biosynthesis monooxygenase [Alteromonas pelagimontana]|uniref:Antibiotic biosynthesis monooxygenase n=1 Tax=Alteromonas pelagimontana TaxID=1858656 RepID=A0A6M4MA03_9ALTE|nr:putative quinol monooxygenase [Alteromonas pelagimontana]QJR79982.1 antibiotic biosynthesis monooxygenase [Alteromonas pelagimontana]
MINVIATVTTQPGKRDEVLKACKVLQEYSRKESGCHRYDLMIRSDDANSLAIYEEWDSRNSLQMHMEAGHFSAFQSHVDRLVKDVTITQYEPVK